MNWTDERVELLKKLWAEGLSASKIAAQLGGVSRNAVIGKVHRLKLSSRGRAAGAAPRQKKTAAAPAGGAASAPRRQRTARPIATTIGATALKVQFEEDAVAYEHVLPVENVVVPISRNPSAHANRRTGSLLPRNSVSAVMMSASPAPTAPIIHALPISPLRSGGAPGKGTGQS